MEKKINIAELLKDCPKGMELDCTIWDNIVFEKIDGDSIVIFRKSANSKVYLTQCGEFNNIDGKCVIFPKGKTTWEGFIPPSKFEDGTYVFFNEVHNWELAPAKKFDISTLKPFESRVLIRDRDSQEWTGAFYSHYDVIDSHPYHCINFGRYKQCIPYEGNEHLLSKTDNCDDYYKTWK